MRLKNVVSIFIILVVSCYIVSAQTIETPSYDLTYEAVKWKISIGEEAEFKFNVKNKNSVSERFRIQNTATNFDLRTNPLYIQLSGQNIYSNSDGDEFTVYLLPEDDIKLGQHEIILNTKFESGEVTQVPIQAYIQPPASLKESYAVSMGIDIVFNDEFDPRKEFVMNINLDNLNRRPLDNVTIKIEGKLINEEITTSLEPLEKGKIVTLKKHFDERLKPQKDTLIITVTADDESVKTLTKQLTIID